MDGRSHSRTRNSSVHHEYGHSKYIENDIVHWTSKCKHCGHELLNKKRVSPSSLKKHLERFHPEVYREVEVKDQREVLMMRGCNVEANIKVKERRNIKKVKSRIAKSHVHLEYVQTVAEEDYVQSWTSNCRHCDHKFNHRLCSELKR